MILYLWLFLCLWVPDYSCDPRLGDTSPTMQQWPICRLFHKISWKSEFTYIQPGWRNAQQGSQWKHATEVDKECPLCRRYVFDTANPRYFSRNTLNPTQSSEIRRESSNDTVFGSYVFVVLVLLVQKPIHMNIRRRWKRWRVSPLFSVQPSASLSLKTSDAQCNEVVVSLKLSVLYIL